MLKKPFFKKILEVLVSLVLGNRSKISLDFYSCTLKTLNYKNNILSL